MLEDAGHAPGRRRHGPGAEVLALGVPRVLEVTVQVDRPGQDHQAAGIDDFVRSGQHPVVIAERGDALPGDDHMGTERPVRGRHHAVGDNPRELAVQVRSPLSPHNVNNCCSSLINQQHRSRDHTFPYSLVSGAVRA